ncbi:MAG: malto-oligosyltrehalose trehalohydrolase, partial [Chloroflexi bacterium]|nr:malto-oligosyltrehalose trehalohydrolase [Chloroflexota bacterium]
MTRLRIWAPHASTVDVIVGNERHRLAPRIYGFHEGEVPLADGTRYALSLDGADPLPDPRSRWQPDGVYGRSAHVAHGRDDEIWRGRDLAASVLYELHVGAFSPEGTFDGVIGKLDHLVALGVDAIELMPVAEFPGERGWGYDGVDLYAAHHAYGGPQGLRRLVRAAHERGLAVVLDVVYNHLGPDGNYLERFGPYFTDRHHTPWGRAMNYDGPDSGPVRQFVVENALGWMRDIGIDGVRLDAIHAIVDLSATHVIEELTRRVDELSRELGRTLWVIAESDLNDPKVVRPRGERGWGCDAQWSDDLHHALHTVLTGERAGYYGDFGRMADLAKALRDAYVYDGRPSDFRRRVHGRPAGDLSGHRFLAYSQDHDQVGNRARGERLSQLVPPDRLRIAAAVVLLSPYVPMLFMGEEWAASTPFLYFTDHIDERLGHAVSEGRRREFERFGWPPTDFVDPQSPASFERSRLDWSELSREPHSSMLAWYRRLIALRREVPELRDGRRDLAHVAFDEEQRWLAMRRGPVTLAFSLDRAVEVPLGVDAGELALTGGDGVRRSSDSVRLPAGGVA